MLFSNTHLNLVGGFGWVIFLLIDILRASNIPINSFPVVNVFLLCTIMGGDPEYICTVAGTALVLNSRLTQSIFRMVPSLDENGFRRGVDEDKVETGSIHTRRVQRQAFS